MPWYKWSQTASANATADGTINWAEGQAPSSVNDSARAMMAATAMYRDDIAGAIVTTGTSTAYSVTSYSGFDTAAHLNGQMIAFSPHTTNAQTVTLSVDSLTAAPLRSSPGVELSAGTIIQGTPYVAVYNSSDNAFYLKGFYGNPYNIPLGGGLDYWLPTAPNSAFVFPIGQAVSRTTYAALFAGIGTTFGTGDGSTTFNLPDKRGRVSIAADASAGRISTATMNGTGIGAVGGAETETLSLSQLPTGITSGNASQAISVTSANFLLGNTTSNSGSSPGGGSQLTAADPGSGALIVRQTSTGNNSISVTSNNTSGAAHVNVQPAIICNYIIRII